MNDLKSQAIKNIICKLKPNTYANNSPQWEKLKNGLNKMSRAEVETLNLLLICKKE